MGAGVGPLVAPAVFRIVIEVKDQSGNIKALPKDYCVPGAPEPKPDYRRLLSVLAKGGFGNPFQRKEGRKSQSVKHAGSSAPAKAAKNPAGQNGELCEAREFRHDEDVKIVWLPTREDPSNADSPITGGVYVIYGDVSVGQADKLNCDIDGLLRELNELNEKGDRLTLRSSANIGPAADENAADWGSRRDVSSTAFGAYCTPPAEQSSGGGEKK